MQLSHAMASPKMAIFLCALLPVAVSLSPTFYSKTCPRAFSIIRSGVEKAVRTETSLAASLLRLHYHDCFVQGCDASLLLDDTATFTGEKSANPNRNSLRGFEVVDEIKAELEKECPGVVSCADTLAVIARDSVRILGGPSWDVPLGRRDSTTASRDLANSNIPAPSSTLQTLLTKFKQQGLHLKDLVALSGAHTIGLARCTSFKQRLYNQNGSGKPDNTVEKKLLGKLETRCPETGTDDNRTFPLDFSTPNSFDNSYYVRIVEKKGLLNSDQLLYSSGNLKTSYLVMKYSQTAETFFQEFAKSMIRMSKIKVLTGSNGQIRANCRKVK